MPTPSTVAVLGLGAMGHAFATNLLKEGFRLQVWNRTRTRALDLERDGARVGTSPRDAVLGARVVLTMLADAEATEAVLLGDDGALNTMAQGGVLLQMGTIGVEATDRLIAAVREQRPDVIFIDAPVSGTKAPAEQGQVLVLASGDRVAAPEVEAVLDAIGKATRWLGPAGTASRMKVAINAWLAAMTQGLAESARLAEALGIDIDTFWSVLDGGPLASPFAKMKLDMMKRGDFQPQFALALGAKDIRLALQAAGDLELPALQQISAFWSEAAEAGGGGEDIAAVYRFLSGA